MEETEPDLASLASQHDRLKLQTASQHSSNPNSVPDDSDPVAAFKAVTERAGTPLGLFIGRANPKTDDVITSTAASVQAFEMWPDLSSGTSLPLDLTTAVTTQTGSPRRADGFAPSSTDLGIYDSTHNDTSYIQQQHVVSSATSENAPSTWDYISSSESGIEPALPLRTGSVHANTKMVHPKPKPIIRRKTPEGSNIAGKTTLSGSPSRHAPFGNIAQLEATAERLSMTSSIDNAIRDLHGELKRSDSKRSSVLAASVKGAQDDNAEGGTPVSAGQLKRHLSTSSSIVPTNIAARHGGYSPAAFVMSPNDSVSGRFRSGSVNSTGRPELETDTAMSRHGSGKVSIRSVRSSKMSLADIAESEPISLNKEAFEKADAAPPIEVDGDDATRPLPLDHPVEMPTTDAFHAMLDSSFAPEPAVARPFLEDPLPQPVQEDAQVRPPSAQSRNTVEQGMEAFLDFDGVHWEPSEEDMQPPPEFDIEREQHDHEMPILAQPDPAGMARPTSYINPESGQTMIYYPARVPAMLNLPPKLSTNPKAAERNMRRSQVMSTMMNINQQAAAVPAHRNSVQPEKPRESWLPDPVAGHRGSFEALSSYGPLRDADSAHSVADEPLSQPLEPPVNVESLRRPQRLSQPGPEKTHQPRASQLDHVSPHLRASAFFDMPSTVPDVEVKESAQATLDGILDASANAPVNAFTDHGFGGKLGSEIYGKEKKKKHKSQPSAVSLGVSLAESPPKKRSSFMWLGKRSTSYNSVSAQNKTAPVTAVSDHNQGGGPGSEKGTLLSGEEMADHRHAEDVEESDEEEEEALEHDEYDGPPTTLLAELQLRKQQQKQRTQNPYSNQDGVYSTLLERDTVAEAQRKDRQSKRVNLAWEEPNAHLDQNGSDDEDVPLAFIAAMQQGAKNKADLDRPIGLMERREIEDNEPLSHRRARLRGYEATPVLAHNRQSMISLLGPQRLGATSPARQVATPEPGPEVEEIEEETLAERRRRLAGQDEPELPKARPVSSAFSTELLSQFGDLETPQERPSSKKQGAGEQAGAEEETLGQRRRRLQAEREAREQEMSYGNTNKERRSSMGRRLSMADVLSAHPKKDVDVRQREQHRQMEDQRRLAREQNAKMAALRQQMPTTLSVPNLNRAGGFQGGNFNDGRGGHRSATAFNRASTAGNGMIAPMQQQQLYGYNNPGTYAGMAPMGGYAPMNGMNAYGGAVMPQHDAAMSTGSIDRVERWRHSVMH